jgi:hypothetical protein
LTGQVVTLIIRKTRARGPEGKKGDSRIDLGLVARAGFVDAVDQAAPEHLALRQLIDRKMNSLRTLEPLVEGEEL